MSRLLVAAVLTATSPFVAWAIATSRAFGPEDLGGLIYLVVLTPLGTALVTAILLRSIRARSTVWMVAVVVGVLATEVAVQLAAVQLRWMPGAYYLPEGFQANGRSIEELRAVLRGQNGAIAFAAVQELGRRQREGADALLIELKTERDRHGPSYVDSDLTREAVETLCAAGDRRVDEFVAEMASSQSGMARKIAARCRKK